MHIDRYEIYAKMSTGCSLKFSFFLILCEAATSCKQHVENFMRNNFPDPFHAEYKHHHHHRIQ